jgi:hypothetical protein
MPRKRSQSERRALYLAVGSVAVALVLLLGIAYLANRGTVEPSNLGDRFFEFDASRIADEIADRGPYLVPDVSGRNENDIYVIHAGESDEHNWRAVDAGERGCTLEWTGTEFQDPCTDETYPLSGDGLVQYEVRVEDGKVIVDLRTQVK